jgi:hypothetical protein
MGAGGLGARAGGVVAGKPTGGGGGAGASAIKQAAQAMKTAVGLLDKSMRLNTTAIGNLNTTINTKLISSIGTLTNTIRSRGMGGGGIPIRGRGPRGFATGGLVPGTGNYDTVPAKLTPGEFVMKKSSVKSIGHSNLKKMNSAPRGYAEGGRVYVNPNNIGVFALRPSASGAETMGKITGTTRIRNPIVTKELKDAGGRSHAAAAVGSNMHQPAGVARAQRNLQRGTISRGAAASRGRDDALTKAFLTASAPDQARAFGFPDEIAQGGVKARAAYAKNSGGAIDMAELKKLGFKGKETRVGVGILNKDGSIADQGGFDKVKKQIRKTKRQYRHNDTGAILKKSGRRHLRLSGLYAGLSSKQQMQGTLVEPDQVGEPATFSGGYKIFRPSPNEIDQSVDLDRVGGRIASGALNEAIVDFAVKVKDYVNPPALGRPWGKFPDPMQSKAAIKNLISPSSAAVDTIKGFLNEGIVGSISGATVAGGDVNFDFPNIAGSAQRGLQNLFDPDGSDLLTMMKGDGKLSGSTKTGFAKGSIAKKMLNDIERGDTRGAIFSGFASGGAVGSDTVSAMLTPGEYVINRKSAQGIGYGNLKRMNEGGAIPDGVKGFAEGGIVTAGREFYGKNKKQKKISKGRQIKNLAIANGISEQQAKKLLAAHNLKGQAGKQKAARLLKEFTTANDKKRAAGKKVATPAPETAVKKTPVSPSGIKRAVAKPDAAAVQRAATEKAAVAKVSSAPVERLPDNKRLQANDRLKANERLQVNKRTQSAAARTAQLDKVAKIINKQKPQDFDKPIRPKRSPRRGKILNLDMTPQQARQQAANKQRASHDAGGGARARMEKLWAQDAARSQTTKSPKQLNAAARQRAATDRVKYKHTNLAAASGVGITQKRQGKLVSVGGTPNTNQISEVFSNTNKNRKAVNPLNAAIARDSANHPGRNVQANASNLPVQRRPIGKPIFTGPGSGGGIPMSNDIGDRIVRDSDTTPKKKSKSRTGGGSGKGSGRGSGRGAGRGAGGGGMGGMGGMRSMGFAMIAMELMMTGPMLIEAMSNTAEGVEEKGQLMTQALMGLGTSLMFAAPMLMGGGMGGKKKPMAKKALGRRGLRGVQSPAGRAAFGKGFGRGRAQGMGKISSFGRGLKGAGGGSMARGLGGTGLGMAALGPAIAGAVAVAISGPLSQFTSGVGKLEKVGKAELKGSRAETQEGARQRGGTRGMIAGAGAGAALGFIAAGPIGAAVAGLIGGVGGTLIGQMEGLSNKIKFDAVAQLNDSAKDASEALIALAKDAFVSKDDIQKANRETSEFINMMSLGSSSFDQADSESAFGRTAGTKTMNALEGTVFKGGLVGMISDALHSSSLEGLSWGDETAQRAGSRTGFQDSMERTFGLSAKFWGGEKNEREVGQDISAGKIVMEGAGFAEVLKEFDPKLAEQSSAALGNAMTSITDTMIKASSDSSATIATLQASIGAIDSTDPRKASQGIQDFIKALELGELGEAGKAAADTIKNDLTLQLASSFQGMTKGMSEQDADFVAAGIKRITEAARSGDPGAYSAAIAQMNTEMNNAGSGFNNARVAFMKITKEAAMSTVAIAQQGVQQAIMNNLLEESTKLIDGMVAAMQKLTGAMEATLNIFDIFVSNTEKRVASLLSGEADFALDDTVNPFENLDIEDLTASGGTVPESITKAFKEIESVGGTGAQGTLKGLESAPQFAQNLPDIMKKAVNQIEEDTIKGGGKLQTQTAMLDTIRQKAIEGGAAEGPILDAFMKQMEKTLTQARQGEGGLDAVKSALKDTGDIVDKFGGATQEVIDQLAAQFNAAKEIAQRASDIAKLQRDVQKRLREFDAKKSEIDQRVGEITGTRKGGLAEAEADLNERIARQTGQAVSVGGRVVAGGVATGNVGALQARQTALQAEKTRIEAARAAPGASTNEALIGQLATVKAALEDTTGALSTLSEDTTRLAAIESEIADLQSKQLAEQDALQSTFERLQGIQEKLASGDFKGAAEDRKAVRADFRAVEKLETGQQLTTGEMNKVLSGALDPLLTAGGKTQEEIAKLKTQASVEARGVAIQGLGQLGIDAAGFFQGVDQGAAIDAKKDEARVIGEQQKSAIEVMEERVRKQTITEMDKLNTAVNELRIQMQMAAFAAEELRNADNVQRRDVKEFEAGAMKDALEEGGGVSTQIRVLDKSPEAQQAFEDSMSSFVDPNTGQTIRSGGDSNLLYKNMQVGGFVPTAAQGDLTKESTRKTAVSEIDDRLKELRPLMNQVSDDDSAAAIQKEINRLVKAKAELANIEVRATKAREDQFEADKIAAKEQAIANIKAHEERIRQNQVGGGMGDAFTRPGGELGVVAPVATGMASGTATQQTLGPIDYRSATHDFGVFGSSASSDEDQQASPSDLQEMKKQIQQQSPQDAAKMKAILDTQRRDPGIKGQTTQQLEAQQRQQYSKTGNVRKDVEALGVQAQAQQAWDSMLSRVADPTAQATPEQRVEIEQYKTAMLEASNRMGEQGKAGGGLNQDLAFGGKGGFGGAAGKIIQLLEDIRDTLRDNLDMASSLADDLKAELSGVGSKLAAKAVTKELKGAVEKKPLKRTDFNKKNFEGTPEEQAMKEEAQRAREAKELPKDARGGLHQLDQIVKEAKQRGDVAMTLPERRQKMQGEGSWSHELEAEYNAKRNERDQLNLRLPPVLGDSINFGGSTDAAKKLKQDEKRLAGPAQVASVGGNFAAFKASGGIPASESLISDEDRSKIFSGAAGAGGALSQVAQGAADIRGIGTGGRRRPFNPQAVGPMTEDEKKRLDILRKEQGEASKKLEEKNAKDEQKQSMDNLLRVSSPVAEPTPQPYTGPTAYEMALAAEQRAKVASDKAAADKVAADKAAADKVAANAAAVAGIDRGMGGGPSLISDEDRKNEVPGSQRFQGLAPASAGFSPAPTPRANTMPENLNTMADIPATVQAADKTRATRDQIQGVSSGNAERLIAQKKEQEALFTSQKKKETERLAREKEISQFGMTEEEKKRKDFFDTRQQAGSPYFDQQKDEDFKVEARARGYDPTADPEGFYATGQRQRGIDSDGKTIDSDRRTLPTKQEQRDLEFKKIQARNRLVTPEAFQGEAAARTNPVAKVFQKGPPPKYDANETERVLQLSRDKVQAIKDTTRIQKEKIDKKRAETEASFVEQGDLIRTTAGTGAFGGDPYKNDLPGGAVEPEFRPGGSKHGQSPVYTNPDDPRFSSVKPDGTRTGRAVGTGRLKLNDSIAKDMAIIREGGNPYDTPTPYTDPKDIAEKQRKEGIAKYNASIPTRTVTDSMGKTRTQKTGYGDESLLNKPGMMASSQQTLASQQGVNVQDLRPQNAKYGRGAKAAVSEAIENKRQAAIQAKKDKDKRELDAIKANAEAPSGVDGMTNAELKRKQYADKQVRKKEGLSKLRTGDLNKGNIQDYINQTGNFTKEKEAERAAKLKAKQEAANATKIQTKAATVKPKQTATTVQEASSFYANQLTGMRSDGTPGSVAGTPAKPPGMPEEVWNAQFETQNAANKPPTYLSGSPPAGGAVAGAGGKPMHDVEAARMGRPQPGAGGAGGNVYGSPALLERSGFGGGGTPEGIVGPEATQAMSSLATALAGIKDGIKIQPIEVNLNEGGIMETIRSVVTSAVKAEIANMPGTGGPNVTSTVSNPNPPANSSPGQ